MFKNLIFFEYFEYLEKECELRLRIILDKKVNNIELDDNEKGLIAGYMFYSLLNHCGNCHDGPDLYTLGIISRYGSGEFNKEQLEIIKEINAEVREERYKEMINDYNHIELPINGKNK